MTDDELKKIAEATYREMYTFLNEGNLSFTYGNTAEILYKAFRSLHHRCLLVGSAQLPISDEHLFKMASSAPIHQMNAFDLYIEAFRDAEKHHGIK